MVPASPSATTSTCPEQLGQALSATVDGAAQVTRTPRFGRGTAVQWWVAQVNRPVRALLAFAKVDLEAGGQAHVRFDVHTDRLAFTGLDGDRIVEPGEIQLYAGSSSTQTPTSAGITVTGLVRTAHKLQQHHVPAKIEMLRHAGPLPA